MYSPSSVQKAEMALASPFSKARARPCAASRIAFSSAGRGAVSAVGAGLFWAKSSPAATRTPAAATNRHVFLIGVPPRDDRLCRKRRRPAPHAQAPGWNWVGKRELTLLFAAA